MQLINMNTMEEKGEADLDGEDNECSLLPFTYPSQCFRYIKSM